VALEGEVETAILVAPKELQVHGKGTVEVQVQKGPLTGEVTEVVNDLLAEVVDPLTEEENGPSTEAVIDHLVATEAVTDPLVATEEVIGPLVATEAVTDHLVVTEEATDRLVATEVETGMETEAEIEVETEEATEATLETTVTKAEIEEVVSGKGALKNAEKREEEVNRIEFLILVCTIMSPGLAIFSFLGLKLCKIKGSGDSLVICFTVNVVSLPHVISKF